MTNITGIAAEQKSNDCVESCSFSAADTYICFQDNNTSCVERFPVQKAHPFTHRGISLFAHKDGKEWKATEVTTGLDIVRAHQFKGKWQNNSKDEIIQTAKEFIDEKTPEKVSELIKYAADTISRTSPCSQVSVSG